MTSKEADALLLKEITPEERKDIFLRAVKARTEKIVERALSDTAVKKLALKAVERIAQRTVDSAAKKVIGNPPYWLKKNMENGFKDVLREKAERAGKELAKRMSLVFEEA